MKYKNIKQGNFIKRLDRFTALIEIDGCEEQVHVKNTGRASELFLEGAVVYVQRCESEGRKTKWDLISVMKADRLVNVDSQVTNHVVREWIEKGKLFYDITCIRPETRYGQSRVDFYIESGERRIFVEVKGVTLEQDGVMRFPDAPTSRGVKHVKELTEAVLKGYEAYIFFVIQMKGARFLTPNIEMDPAFGQALKEAAAKGVHLMAYDCHVAKDSISLRKEVPVILGNEVLRELTEPISEWFRKHQRKLPWRENADPYRIWVSEIMLQQTRVEAVKPFYERFLQALPTVKDLAEAKEDVLLKLWEGLGYYNRVRNMQKAARQVMIEYHGDFPQTYEAIRNLTGIGNYTAGAIGSFAFGVPRPAVDGNVLRVISRILGSYKDIMKPAVREEMEHELEVIMPRDNPADFNQGLIELGAIVCVPNGTPKCEICPAAQWCQAYQQNLTAELPVKSKAKKRRIEQKTILIFKDGETIGIKKRDSKGLLAGLYEFPNVEGWLTQDEVIAYSRTLGLEPIYIETLRTTKHIFSHVEWQMIGYAIRVDELEKSCREDMIFAHPEEIQNKYPIPTAFEGYTEYINIKLGQDKYL